MRKQAEKLKTEFGCALADETNENEIISIDNIKGREPREISRKNLSYIIQARLEEIFEHVYQEIQRSGYEKALAGGLVLTGGGAQLSYVAELAEYITGLDTRLGYPTEHLSDGMIDEVKSPLYATATGLMMGGLNSANHPATSLNQNEKDSPKRKRWLDAIFEKGKKWLEDNQDFDDFK
jgi:cell division protein FtsA